VERSAVSESIVFQGDRQELALRALSALQLPDGGAAPPGDPLRQIGLERWRFGSAQAPGAPAEMEFATVRSRGGQLRRQQLHFGGNTGPVFHLEMLNIDRGFNRFQDLTQEEQSWAGAMRGMRRMDLGAEKLALAGGLSNLGLLELSDGKARARRLSLGLTGGRWTVQALSQHVDGGFQRLSDLTGADQKLFSAERGIARNSLDLGYAFSQSRKFSASNLLLRAASGGVERHQLEYQDGSRLRLHFDFGRVDPKFDRINDLLAADKSALAPLRGTRWSDLTANVSPTRWLTMENQWRDGASLDTRQRSTHLRNAWTFQLASRTKLVLLRDLLTAPEGTTSRGRSLTQSLRLEQSLGHALVFSGFRESVRNGLTGGSEINGRRTALHLNTAPGLKLQGTADYTTSLSSDGKYERALQWSLGLPLRRGLTLQAKGDAHDLPGHTGTRALSLGLTGQIARDWDLTFSSNSVAAPHAPGTRDLGLRLTFAGLRPTPLLRETHLVFGLGDTTGLPSALPAPVTTARPAPAAAGPPSVPARRLQSVTMESKLRGQPIAVGYTAAAGTAGGLTYRLTTDPKRRVQFEGLREIRDLGHTSLVARQRYAIQAKLNRMTQLSCSYETQPEQSPGKLLLGHRQTKAEAQTILAGLAASANLAWDQDELRGVTSTLTGFSLIGNVDPQDTLRFSLTDRTHGSDAAIPAHELSLGYERKPEEFLKLALSANWQAWGGPRRDELAWQLDLTAVF
jgi:hypothetical protein